MRFRELDGGEIIATIETLERRVAERFPESGLRAPLRRTARASPATPATRVEAIARPNRAAPDRRRHPHRRDPPRRRRRARSLHLPATVNDFGAFAQALDAGINDVVFLGIAIFFLLSLERRIKRRRALAALHELRSIAHIVDMHQLTKDPEHRRWRAGRPRPARRSAP